MNKVKMNIVTDPEDNECAMVRIVAKVEGDEFDFLLDTGAALSRIKNCEYTLYYPKVRTKQSYSVVSQSNDVVIRIPSLRIGSLRKDGVEFTRVDTNDQQSNLLGMNVLKDLALFFDFQNNLLDINPENRSRIKGNDLYMDKNDHPYLSVMLKETVLAATYDTGASITIVDQAIFDTYPEHFEYVSDSKGEDANGNEVKTMTYLLTGLMIDGNLFPPHHVVVLDLAYVNGVIEKKMDMILGYSTIKYFNWWFNFLSKKWSISKFNKI